MSTFPIASAHVIASVLKRIFGLDRKSTRLNSSHVRISYAVFCLKKKTIDVSAPLRLSSRRRPPRRGEDDASRPPRMDPPPAPEPTPLRHGHTGPRLRCQRCQT